MCRTRWLRDGIGKDYRRLQPAGEVCHSYRRADLAGGQAQESALLASCYRESLKIAEEKGLMTVAFPAISCGVYGFPIPEACTIAMNTVYSYLLTAPSLRKIIFACFNDLVKKELERALRERVADTIR